MNLILNFSATNFCFYCFSVQSFFYGLGGDEAKSPGQDKQTSDREEASYTEHQVRKAGVVDFLGKKKLIFTQKSQNIVYGKL